MEKFIIYLPKYENSLEWATRALNSGNQLNWDLKLFEGVDGTECSLEQYNIHPSNITKKCFRLMQRPGTIGCFLSHYNLWNYAIKQNKSIGIFEHDVIFLKEPPVIIESSADIVKYEGFKKAKPIPCGNWWEGARAYVITPVAAKKLVEWANKNGAMPADWMLCDGLVNIEFDLDNRVTFSQNNFSFTRDLI